MDISHLSQTVSQPAALTEAQSGLFYAQRLAPDNPAFNTAHVLWMTGDLQTELFKQAVDQVTQSCDSFAMHLIESDSGPRQARDENRLPWLEVVDLSDREHPQAAARELMFRERMSPLDPVRDRLVKQILFRLSTHEFAWYVRMHHLATDGYGMALYADRVSATYNSLIENKAFTGQPLGPYQAVLSEDQTYRQSEKRQKDAAYWKETLAGMPAPTGLGPGMAAAAHDCLRLIRPLDQELQTRIHEVSAEIGQPWPDVLTCLCAAYCQRMSGVSEAVIGVPFMGRLGSVSARVPMMVMNVIPVRVSESSDLSVKEFVNQLTKSLLKGRRHGRYRGEQMRRDLGLIGGQRRLYGPLINVQPFYHAPQISGVQEELEILCTGPVDDINLGFRGDAVTMFDLEIEANPHVYSQVEIEEHADRLIEFLKSAFAVQSAGGRMAEIPLATTEEAQRYLFDVNATSHVVQQTTLVALFEAKMRETPHAPALEFGESILTYQELEVRTRALALQLRRLGVQRESIVAVALHRSLELVIALLAIQRAGGAYLPVDLDHPDSRIATILKSANPVCVLSTATDATRFEAMSQVLPTDRWELKTEAELTVEIRPQDAAYVIYTSGSTGDPKGVLIEHQAIVNRLEWMRTFYHFDASDRFLQKTPATFDVSVWEFFLPYLTGASLVVAPPDAHRDPMALARLIREQRITTLHFVPSMLSAFLAAPESAGLKLRRVFCSGEELTADQRDLFHKRVSAELHNLYGPTEAAVDVSYWEASGSDVSRPIPIGFPVWNTRLYVLDEKMRPLPPGVAGDLYLGGVQLARGYLGRPDLTADRFLEDPFLPGERIYQTGDIARWSRDGSVIFLGRSDHQVKLRGLRIELGEIESAVMRAPGVKRAEVMLREDRPGDKRIVAYVQAENFDAQSLRVSVSLNVPDYMVPAAFMELKDWPVTANGKLDRRALPVPQAEAGAGIPLSSETEKQLAHLFLQVLELEIEIGGDADFFALGGDSLTAVHLLIAIQKQWNRDPGLESLFTSPTVAGLARVIDAGVVDHLQGLGPVIRLSESVEEQLPLFVVHPAGGICWNYRELAFQLQPRRTVYGLQSPDLTGDDNSPESIETLAKDYADRVTSLQPEGPIHLLGWSVGGIIAQAMAVELAERGRKIGTLALLDAYPADCWRAEPEPDPIAALRALLAIAGYDPEGHPELDTRSKIIAFLRRGQSGLGNLPEEVLDGVVRAVTGTNRLVREHFHKRFDGTLLHLRAGRDHVTRPHLQSRLWEDYAANVEAIELPFLHAELTGRDASACIAPIMDKLFSDAKSLQQDELGVKKCN